jgi:geranylgeranylglycerol-phosphate geranylgeranyltransferase
MALTMKGFPPWFQITRPHNCLGASLAVLLGAYLAEGPAVLSARPTLLAGIVVWCIVAGNNVVNDLHDLQVDRLQKPYRALPSGRLAASTASRMAWMLFLGSLILAGLIGAASLLVALLAIALGVLYSLSWKNSVLIGNGVVGLLSGLAVIYGGLAASRVDVRVLLAAASVGLFVFSREILKTVADLEGDSRVGISTIATRMGSQATLRLFTALVGLFVLVIAAPWFIGYASDSYLIAVNLGICIPFVVVTALLWLRFSQAHLLLALKVTKMLWFIGLLALGYLR